MTITINGTGTVTGANTLTNTNTVTSAAATALTLQSAGTTAVTIDTSQNVGIGTNSPGAKFAVGNFTDQVQAGISGAISIIYFGTPNNTSGGQATLSYNRANGLTSIGTSTAGGSLGNAVNIDLSGNLLVGVTSSIADGANTTSGVTIAKGFSWIANSDATYFQRLASDGTVQRFLRGATQVGSISVTSTTTSYATSSDYRLKNTIAPMTGALAKVAALKPVTYKWNADNSDGEGFIAHELAEVCSHAVTGEKDAVDAEGKPQYQGIDVSFLIATLTAAIQEQQALITSLTTRITALENK
jgi:hypothetical protein